MQHEVYNQDSRNSGKMILKTYILNLKFGWATDVIQSRICLYFYSF